MATMLWPYWCNDTREKEGAKKKKRSGQWEQVSINRAGRPKRLSTALAHQKYFVCYHINNRHWCWERYQQKHEGVEEGDEPQNICWCNPIKEKLWTVKLKKEKEEILFFRLPSIIFQLCYAMLHCCPFALPYFRRRSRSRAEQSSSSN